MAVVDTLAKSVAIEMDLRMEAAAISEMAENSKNDEGFRVPNVDWTPQRAARADARMDRRHPDRRSRRAARRKATI